MVLVVAETNPSKVYKDSRPQSHLMLKDQILSIVKKSGYKLEHLDTSLKTYDIYVLKVDKEKESNVWSNWLNEFQLEVNKVKGYEKNKDISAVKKRIAWERVLNCYRDNNPDSGEDEQLRELINEKVIMLREYEKQFATTQTKTPDKQKPSDFSGIHLRSKYQSIEDDEISKIFKRLGFKAILQAQSGDFQNQFKPIANNGDKVVIDNATGLM